MSQQTLAFYRLPIPSSAQIGHLRVVIDRNQQAYLAGHKIVGMVQNGEFTTLTLANDQLYHVKTAEYQALFKARRKR